MSRPQDVGDNKNYYADDGTGFDSEGYVLAPGVDDARGVQKHDGAPETPVVGINHMSTYNHDKTEVLDGEPVAVHHEGEVNVLCEADTTYEHGDLVHAGEGGIAIHESEASDEPEVGKVCEDTDVDADGPGVVPVNITGRV